MNPQDERRRFDEDGYVLRRRLFDDDEMALVRAAAERDVAVGRPVTELSDGNGRVTRFRLWYDLTDDLYSDVVRCDRVVDTVERLLGEPVYHYHSKVMLKQPRVGGSWLWHQDYGYWYHYGFLFPRLISCMIALDHATLGNGCLKVVRGSHRMGRLEHALVGEQIAADPERVAQILDRMDVEPVELEPGDALFFGCNVLHGSSENASDQPRWSFITCFNAKSNQPFAGYERGRPMYQNKQPRSTELIKVPDAALRERIAHARTANEAGR
ncbi:MAG TPA: phytanoyl-CoA dioxygenase family protein [Kofleriaceae bacterium]|nr:phytanoyl-CoA dioxygenase family protein [Kofleriaceae bacterium]